MRNLYLTPVKAACLLLSFQLFFQSIHSQPILGFTPVVSGLSNPVDIVPEPGSNRLFIVQQGGLIRIVNGNSILGTPFLNVSSLLTGGSEQGLLSMAFHPGYTDPANGYFFIYYTNTSGQITIARYRRSSADIADAGSGVVLLSISKNAANHNGGKLIFGSDGNLYFATGDGGGSNDDDNNAQTGTSLLGKMIRLNVDNFATPPFYTIPADNPFVSNPAVRDEIWALGLRNPWRWSFDRNTGDVWIADVGQGAWEEVNHTTLAGSKGVNFGWHCREGNHATPGVTACTPSGTYVPPIFEYGHNNATGGFSITGGYVYHGTAWPSLTNYFVCADYVSGNMWVVQANGTFTRQSPGTVTNISTFGQDNSGELYALSRTGGTLNRIIVTNEIPLPLTLIQFSGKDQSGYNELTWKTGYEENIQKYIIEYSLNGVDYQTAGEVLARYGSNGGSYTFRHQVNNRQVLRYRLHIVEIDNKFSYSPIISIGDISKGRIQVYPTIVRTGMLNIISSEPVEILSIYSLDGKQVYVKYMSGITGYSSIPISGISKGMYLLKLSGKDYNQTDKIIIE